VVAAGSLPGIAAGVVAVVGTLPGIVAGVAAELIEGVVAIVAGISFPGHPNIVGVPNAFSVPNLPSSVLPVDKELSGVSTDDLATDGYDNHLSTAGEPFRKKTACLCSKPSLYHSDVNDTSDLPMVATTSRHRKRYPLVRQGLRKHTSRG